MKQQAERVDVEFIDSVTMLVNPPARQKNKCLVI